MNNYLQQFKKLSPELQSSVSSLEKIGKLEEIEKKFNLKLAKVVIRLMIKDISWFNFEEFAEKNFQLTKELASELKKDLRENIFNEVLGFLEKLAPETQKQDTPPIFKSIETSKIDQGAERLIFKNESSNLSSVKTQPQQPGQEIEKGKDELNLDKIKTLKTITPIKSDNFTEIIKKIKQKLNLVLEDHILENRFNNILISYLKDVRNEMEVKEILNRSRKTGGLEFTPEKIEIIIKTIKDFKKEIHYSDKFLKQPEKKDRIKGIVIDKKPEEIKKRFEQGSIQPFFNKINESLKTPELPKPSNSISSLNQLRQKDVPTNQAKEQKIKITRNQQSDTLISDVKDNKYHAVGLTEELAEITLLDLERWGGGEKTAKIILDKINLLTEESLFRRIEGIRAWRKSPLYKLYLDLGHEALEKKTGIFEIIRNRENQKQQFLKFDDFLIISELNKKLSF